MASFTYTPLPVRFDSHVRLTLHQAFLSTAGVLLADPVARVHVVTVKTAHTAPPSATGGRGAAADGIRTVLSAREVAKSAPRFFTAHPTFDETFTFSVTESSALTALAGPGNAGSAAATAQECKKLSDGESVVDYVVITMESADGTAFYGEAYAPFSPHCASAVPAEHPVRVMLAPRNAQNTADPLFAQDNAVLAAKFLDDFGFVTLSWEVTVVPLGGALVGGPATPGATAELSTSSAPFPVGLALRATWLARAAAYVRGAEYTTSVEFGGKDRFLFSDPMQPLCLTLQSGSADLRRAVFHCAVQSVVEPAKSHDVAVPLPLPPLSVAAARNRDVRWVAPVRTAAGVDLGLLLVTMRVSSKPLAADAPRCPVASCEQINDPLHQETCQHVAQLWGKPAPPQTPPGAYQPIAWESQRHVTEAGERHWKRQCVVDAQPTPEHVRHLFDVLMGRASLDVGVARVAASFSTKSPAEVTAGDLRELMVGFAFHATPLTVLEAARFCFVALRRDVADAVAAEEVQYIVDHCLLEKTIDMPAGERRRWVTDLFSDVSTVSYQDYTTYVLRNHAFWAALGVPLTVAESASSGQRQHAALHRPPGVGGVVFDVAALAPPSRAPAAPAARSASPGAPAVAASSHGAALALAAALADPASSNVWRTFVVRLAQTPQRAFSVTAHAADRVSDVMAMVEGSTSISATRQEWRIVTAAAGGGVPDSSAASVAAAQKPLDPSTLVGSTTLGLPSALRSSVSVPSLSDKAGGTVAEVWAYEAEESVHLRFHVRDRSSTKRDWQERFPTKEKVLKVRAAVQHKTLIPLSRCRLTLRRGDGSSQTLQDRHTLAHYHLVSGDVVEVAQE